MSDELYLESAIRDRLGLSDSLIKKTRKDVVAGMEKDPCRTVVIHGRSHTAYGEEMVKAVVLHLCGKKTRGGGSESVLAMESIDMTSLLAAALIQGVTEEISAKKTRAELITLTVHSIRNNLFILLAVNPDGADLPPVRLRVKDTRRFGSGMEVPGCRHIEGDLYRYEGREPRGKGRW